MLVDKEMVVFFLVFLEIWFNLNENGESSMVNNKMVVKIIGLKILKRCLVMFIVSF